MSLDRISFVDPVRATLSIIKHQLQRKGTNHETNLSDTACRSL